MSYVNFDGTVAAETPSASSSIYGASTGGALPPFQLGGLRRSYGPVHLVRSAALDQDDRLTGSGVLDDELVILGLR